MVHVAERRMRRAHLVVELVAKPPVVGQRVEVDRELEGGDQRKRQDGQRRSFIRRAIGVHGGAW